jgi:3-keto-disaccharide hydrolase
MTRGYPWLRTVAVVAAGVAFAMIAASPAAWPRARKKAPTPTPTETPTPTATPTPESKVWNFDEDKSGGPAAGWKTQVGDWVVEGDPTAPSQPNAYGLPGGWMRQLNALAHGLNYSLLTILDDPTEYADFTLEASIKPVKGRFDCSGGIIFRYADPGDFYLLSAGCPSDYFTLTRVTKGAPDVLTQKVVPTDQGNWYKIKVEAIGDHFSCFDNDKMIFDFTDSKIAKGRIGLWAANDSQAEFDNVTLTPMAVPAEAGAAASPAAPPPPPPPLPPPPPRP